MPLPRHAILLAAFALFPAFAARGTDATNLTTPVDVNVSVRTWLQEHVEKPVAPFQLVPGKPASDWAFAVEPYLWAPALSSTLTVGHFPTLSFNANPAQVISKIDWGIMLRGEVRKGRFGLLADGMFAQFTADGDPKDVLYKSASAQFQTSFDSLALSFRVIDGRSGYFDVYAGARYYYLGLDLSGQTNPEGIQNLANTSTDNITTNLSRQATSFLQKNAGLSPDELAAKLRSGISSGALSEMAGKSREVQRLMSSKKWAKAFNPDSHAMRDYLSALAANEVAKATGGDTSGTSANLETAKQKLADDLANGVDKVLPRRVSTDEWWIDPIIGFRAQLNLTHWLYLNTQADVGGFGAGSQLAWFVQGALGLNFTRNVALELGYRYMYFDYVSGPVTMTTSMPGAYGGIVFRF